MPRLAIDRAERRPPSRAALVFLRGRERGKRIDLEHSPFTLGSGEDCSHVLQGDGVARHHCTLERDGDTWTVRTTTGAPDVRVRDELVSAAPLVHRTRVQIGSIVLYFLDDRHGTFESEYFGLLYDLATIDDLTGVHTPRFMRETTDRGLRHAAHEQRTCTLLLLALERSDDDTAMVAAARASKRCMPNSGVLGLTEDRQLALLLLDVTLTDATNLAAQMQAAVADALAQLGTEPLVRVGGATSETDTTSVEELWRTATRALEETTEGNWIRVVAVPG
jgi:GGDEF domain-containing protein